MVNLLTGPPDTHGEGGVLESVGVPVVHGEAAEAPPAVAQTLNCTPAARRFTTGQLTPNPDWGQALIGVRATPSGTRMAGRP